MTPASQAQAIAELKSEVAILGSQLRRRESDGVQAVRGEVAEENRQLRKDAEGAVKAAALARSTRAHAERVAAAASAKQMELEAELGVTNKVELRKQSELAEELTKERGVLRIRIATKERMVAMRDEKLVFAQEKFRLESEGLTQQLSESELKSSERLTTIRSMMGRLGGRPIVNRGEDELADCNASTAQSCVERMAARIQTDIGECGADGAVSPDALMKALRDGGWIPTVWESEIFWEWRIDWLRDMSDDLRVVWTPEQTMRLRDKLCISMDKLDELRFEFSHYRVGTKLHPRPWVINPWSNARVNFPQPVVPRSGAGGWHRLVKLAQEKWGLRMDAAGRVAQRSFRDVVKQQLERDGARGILSPLTVEQPLTIVLGADGTGVGKRGIMHVGSSIAPSYKEGIAQQNERNLNTVATSVTDDHWGGVDETLCAGYYTGKVDELPEFCIAAEVDRINADGHIDGVPAKAVGCFDLVAARGIRGGRGRCACHAEATTAEERFSVPDLNGCESDDEIIGKLEAVALLKNREMRDDSHTHPAD